MECCSAGGLSLALSYPPILNVNPDAVRAGTPKQFRLELFSQSLGDRATESPSHKQRVIILEPAYDYLRLEWCSAMSHCHIPLMLVAWTRLRPCRG